VQADVVVSPGPLITARPLVLDLDGTVSRTNTLVESVLRLAARAPMW